MGTIFKIMGGLIVVALVYYVYISRKAATTTADAPQKPLIPKMTVQSLQVDTNFNPAEANAMLQHLVL